MSTKICLLIASVVLLLCVQAVPVSWAADEAEPKYKIKDVMKHAMKGPLLKKVAGGEASDEEKKELHAMLVAMGKSKPPVGDDESWKKLTSALVKASESAVAGDAGAGEMLTKSANCKACHSVHQPKK